MDNNLSKLGLPAKMFHLEIETSKERHERYVREYDDCTSNYIILNGDWLYALGFKFRIIDEHTIYQEYYYNGRLSIMGLRRYGRSLDYYIDNIYTGSIKYVHELKNIYQNLTGEELKLDMKWTN